MENMEQTFLFAVAGGIEKIHKDLAYLALTSKPEHAVRDAVALHLHHELDPSKFLVGRELHLSDAEQKRYNETAAKRKGGIDLAVLDANRQGKDDFPAKLVAEFKAMYSFDVVKKDGEICKGMRSGIFSDIQRSAWVGKATKLKHAYVVVLVFLPSVAVYGEEVAMVKRIARYKMAESPARLSSPETPHVGRIRRIKEIFQAGRLDLDGERSFPFELIYGKGDEGTSCGTAYGVGFSVYPFVLRVPALQ